MSDAGESLGPGKLPLGVGRLLGETFRHYPAVTVRVFGFALIVNLIHDTLLEPTIRSALTDGAGLTGGTLLPMLSLYAAEFMISSLGSAFLFLASAATAVIVAQRLEGQKVDLRQAIIRALRYAVPVVVLGVILNLVSGLATLAFIVPGIYAISAFAVLIPVVVLEGTGFSSMTRTLALTRGYRWSLVMTWVVPFIVSAGVYILGDALITNLLIGEDWQNPRAPEIAVTASWVVLAAVVTPLDAIATTLLYFRLREIKEGGDVSQLSRVFE